MTGFLSSRRFAEQDVDWTNGSLSAWSLGEWREALPGWAAGTYRLK